MHRLKVIVVAGAVLMSVIGCAHRPIEPYDPFKSGAQEFFRKLKIIALVPVRLPEGVLESDTVKRQFEAALEGRLREIGFDVVPSEVFRESEERKARESGGYFDVKTGEPDEEKCKSVQGQTRNELNVTRGAEAFLYGVVRVVEARFYGETASWNGTQESISKTGKRSEASRIGSVGALSLGIWIMDQKGSYFYVNWGGIQLLSKLEDKGKIFANVRFVSVPEEEILSNREKNENAVATALGRLLYWKKKQLSEPVAPTEVPAKKEP